MPTFELLLEDDLDRESVGTRTIASELRPCERLSNTETSDRIMNVSCHEQASSFGAYVNARWAGAASRGTVDTAYKLCRSSFPRFPAIGLVVLCL